jgi:hypothetical protein
MGKVISAFGWLYDSLLMPYLARKGSSSELQNYALKLKAGTRP